MPALPPQATKLNSEDLTDDPKLSITVDLAGVVDTVNQTRDYLTGLLGADGVPATARTSLGALDDGPVTTAKLGDDAVTLAKLAGGTAGKTIGFDGLGDPAEIDAILDSDISQAEGLLRKTGAGAYEAMKTNLSASADPGATDDSAAGYAVGSRWINTTADKEFVCLDATAAAAVWTETTQTGSVGEVNTGSNLGAGVGIFEAKVAADLRFNSLVGAAGIDVTEDDPNDEIDIALSDMAQATIKGRAGGAGTGAPTDLSDAQVRAILNVEDGATADQTDAEIKTAYEANADTNAFTDAEKTTVGNQSGVNTGDEAAASRTVAGVAEIATEAEIDTGTDDTRSVSPLGLAGSALQTKVDGIEALADVTDAANVAAAGAVMDSDISEGEGLLRKTGAGAYEAMKTNLGASADPGAADDSAAGYAVGSRWINTTADREFVCLDATAAAAVWAETTAGVGGTHAASHTDGSDDIQDATAAQKGLATAAQITKLDAIEAGATADQTGAEVKTAYEGEVNTNAFTDAEQAKLGGIEAAADVTDAANVASAGAAMLAGADQVLSRTILKDYGETVNVIGSIGGGTQDIDLTLGNVATGTVDTSTTTLTFSNPAPSPAATSFSLVLTNGGSQTIVWPASVDWPGGTSPTLAAAGADLLVFTTVDAGATWHGALAQGASA